LARRLERAVAREKEILVDPAFFAALSLRLDIADVRTMPKAADGDNELTRFRFDGVVTVAGGARGVGAAVAMTPWPEGGDIGLLTERLSGAGDAFGYSAIPNRRLARPLAAIAWIDGDGAPDAVLDPISANLDNYLDSVIPGLDPGTSQRRLTGGLQAEVPASSAHLLKGGTRIKSGYDGKVGDSYPSVAPERLMLAHMGSSPGMTEMGGDSLSERLWETDLL
jgi:hypothetical protein